MEQLATGYGLIEGPVWDDERGLAFSDVTHGGVFAIGRAGVVTTMFEHRRGIGGMARHASGTGLIVSGRNIAFKPYDGSATVTLLTQDESAAGVGFNDITTDIHGRLYVGELGASPFAADRTPTPGVLWLVDLDGSATVVGDDVLLTNGLGFSPDGDTLYHSESQRGAVMRYDVRDDGTLGPKQLFAEVEHGAPDGLVVSEDGAVWVALAGGGGVSVHETDGRRRRFIDIPVPMCTSVCFGGADLRTLYIVSGSDGSGDDRAGGVWCVDTDVRGVPVAPARIPVAGHPRR